MTSLARATACLLFPIAAAAQSAAPLDAFSALKVGPNGVGYRMVVLRDPTRPATFSPNPASTLDVFVHLWYPAAAKPEGCLTFGDYVAGENGPANAEATVVRLREAREGFAALFGSFPDKPAMTDAGWDALVSARVRACANATPTPGKHPVLIGRHLAGLWPLQGEYFASHGYVVAMVVSRGGINLGAVPPQDRPRVIGRQIEFQARDFDVLVSMFLAKDSTVDLARVGVLAQAPAPILFAMQRPGLVKAIAVQDAALFAGGLTSEGARRSASWNPAALTGALLITESTRDTSAQPFAADFEAMSGLQRYRLRFETPLEGHADLSSEGYLSRRAFGLTGAHAALITAFEANVRTQHALFDAWVRGDGDRRQVLDAGFATLVPPAIATLQVTPARAR